MIYFAMKESDLDFIRFWVSMVNSPFASPIGITDLSSGTVTVATPGGKGKGKRKRTKVNGEGNGKSKDGGKNTGGMDHVNLGGFLNLKSGASDWHRLGHRLLRRLRHRQR
jgi:hypothetical protein